MFDHSIVRNPEIFQQNRLEAHSDHIYYHKKAGDCQVLLNGTWNFSYAENYEQAIKGFEAPEYDCHGWVGIRVPGHIQLQGYDSPKYVNVQYPWDGIEEIRPGGIPEKYNPTASYVKYFDVPEAMKGRPLFISFQGVESAFALWLNGEYVGYSEDSFTPSEFELTPYLQEGENKLAVQVYKWSAGSWCEDQDFFRFSGIFRDVYLYTVPEVHVRDLKVETLLDDVYKDAVLRMTLKVWGEGTVSARLCKDGQMIGSAGQAVRSCQESGTAASDADRPEVKTAKRVSTEALLEIPVSAPALWSAEDPALYDLEITTLDASGQIAETVTEKVGFRRFEIKDSIMYLNGKRIVFKGVNRHEFTAENGRVMTEDIIRFDLTIMKQNNINAIRTSHYPNRTELYRLCDEFGFYVIDETNLETHGTWDPIKGGKEDISFAVPGNRPEYTQMVLDRANSMYQRDKNHACVLIWSCGNESFGGTNLVRMAEFFHSVDAGRPVHYEGVYNDRRYDVSDMESTMYAPVTEIKEWLSTHRDKPYINCEYAHAMGNSCGALQKYTDLTETEPLFQGGFIWDYIDQCLKCTDPYGQTFYGYGGDFLDRPNDGNFSGNGIVYGDDRLPTPKMQEVKFCYQNIKITFEECVESPCGVQAVIWNKSLFTNTDQYDCSLILLSDGEEISRIPADFAVAPEETKRFAINMELPEDGKEHILTVSFTLKEDTLWARAGHEAAYGQYVFPKSPTARDCGTAGAAAGIRAGLSAPGLEDIKAVSGTEDQKTGAAGRKLRLIRGWSNYGVEGENFSVLFSELQGGLISYKWEGRELIEASPRPNFWRAVTDNDIANLLPARAGVFKASSQFITNRTSHGRGLKRCQVVEEDNSILVLFTYYLAAPGDREVTLSYRVLPDGTIDTGLTLPPCADLGELPELSVLFTFSPALSDLRWYGPGPMDSYPDRPDGKIGIWGSDVKDQPARYLRPQESGWHVNTRFAELRDKDGHGIRFTMGDGMGFSALPYTPHQIETAAHPNELPQIFHTYVRVGLQMGVGGDDTWGALTHPEFLLDNSGLLKVHFSLKGI